MGRHKAWTLLMAEHQVCRDPEAALATVAAHARAAAPVNRRPAKRKAATNTRARSKAPATRNPVEVDACRSAVVERDVPAAPWTQQLALPAGSHAVQCLCDMFASSIVSLVARSGDSSFLAWLEVCQ